ncbi:MAG: hypothetical protein QOJ35_3940 [Solirubrobacteraceae bacterium]|nr:hypothetical protein [Solirubrobacteraceae bacterium]
MPAAQPAEIRAGEPPVVGRVRLALLAAACAWALRAGEPPVVGRVRRALLGRSGAIGAGEPPVVGRVRRALVAAACAGALIAGCGDGPRGDGARTGAATGAPNAASVAIAIARPRDGSRLRARRTPGGRLRAGASLRGTARPRATVFLNAGCRPQPCAARATARPDGRWTARITLTTTATARFVTIDASSQERGTAPGAAVTTVELVGPVRPRAARSPYRPRTGLGRREAAATPPRRTLPHDVLVIGDSLAIGMEAPLRAALPGWQVRSDARIGRPLAEGMRILAAQRDAPAIVAFSLFTNDDPSATAALARAVQATAARPGGCAVWATIVRPPYNGVSYAAANDVLVALAGEPRLALGLQLVDWAGAVAQSPSFVAGDGVHGTPEGYRARGELYAAAIRACAGDT